MIQRQFSLQDFDDLLPVVPDSALEHFQWRYNDTYGTLLQMTWSEIAIRAVRMPEDDSRGHIAEFLILKFIFDSANGTTDDTIKITTRGPVFDNGQDAEVEINMKVYDEQDPSKLLIKRRLSIDHALIAAMVTGVWSRNTIANTYFHVYIT